MESDKASNLVCEECSKEFLTTSSKNRHMRNVHKKVTSEQTNVHIICPLCSEEEKFSSYNILTQHLRDFHGEDIVESILNFRNLEEFEAWRALDNKENDYACNRRNKARNGEQYVYYYCNRSDVKGYISTCEKRSLKRGGSIRIRGVCPSRILLKILNNGLVKVTFVETHVGHTDELRTKRLSKFKSNIGMVQQEGCSRKRKT